MNRCIRPLVTQTASTALGVALFLTSLIAAPANAQCTPGWLPGVAGNAGVIYSIAPAANGDVFAGGFFMSLDGVPANSIARWNGATWTALGTGVNLQVQSIAVTPTGDVIVGGDFSEAGGVAAANVAIWNGTTWAAMGGGLPVGQVAAIRVLSNGDVVAARRSVGGATDAVWKWDGTAWSPLAGFRGDARALVVLPNGDLVVGGPNDVGFTGFSGLARWDGTSWSSLGELSEFGGVEALAVLTNGQLVVGGNFTSVGGVAASRVALWNGFVWSALGDGLGEYVTALAAAPNGDILAGSDQPFPALGSTPAAQAIIRWDGVQWTTLGTGVDSQVKTILATDKGVTFVGGAFSNAGGAASSRFARWAECGTCCDGGGSCTLVATGYDCVGGTFRAGATCLPSASSFSATAASPPVVSDASDNGNGNSIAEPGENAIALTVPILNRRQGVGCGYVPGTPTVTGVSATLSAVSPTATVISGNSVYPDLAFNATGANSTPFIIAVSDVHQCGAPITLRLTLTSDAGSQQVDFTVPVGIANASPFVRSRIGDFNLIPDNDQVGLDIPFVVSGIPEAILDLDFRFDGSDCSDSSPGSATTGLGHNQVNELIVKLTSPSGTTVTLISQNGGGRNGFCQLTFDDDALSSIGSVSGSGSSHVSGTYRPTTPLSAFNGLSGAQVNGTWIINVADLSAGNGGTIRDFSLIFKVSPSCVPAAGICCGSGGSCTVVFSPGACASGTFNPDVKLCSPPAPAFLTPSGGAAPVISDASGNNDGVADPGETVQLTFPIINNRHPFGCGYVSGTPTVTGVVGTLTSLTPTATIVTATAAYPDMEYDAQASNPTPLAFALTTSHPCNSSVTLRVTLSAEGGQPGGTFDFTLTTGEGPSCATFAAAPPVSVTDSTGNGNGNGRADPGETSLGLTLPVRKTSGAALTTAITGTLTSLTATASVVSGTATYPDLANGATVSNVTPFVIAIDPSHPCDTPVSLQLVVSTDGGLGGGVMTFSVPVGLPPQGQSLISVPGINASIPDNSAAGVNVPIVVTGFSGQLGDVDLRINGSSTGTDPNITNTGIGHATVGQLVIKLTSPQGTTVTLMSQPGSPAASTSNNMRNVVFNDQAVNLIQNIGSLTTVVTGSYVPANPLSAFNGQVANGTWTLNVADVVADPGATVTGGEGGWVRAVTLAFRGQQCMPPLPSMELCCRGTTCNSVTAGACTGTAAGSASIVVGSCGGGSAFATCCYADFNHDGTQSIDDLFLYFNAYFTTSPMADFGGTGISQPTIDDLFLYINAYFGSCS